MKYGKLRRIIVAIISIVAVLVAGILLFHNKQQETPISRPFSSGPAPTIGTIRLSVPQAYQNPEKVANPPKDPYMSIADTVVKPGGQAYVELQFESLGDFQPDKPIVLSVKNLNHSYTAPALIEQPVMFPAGTKLKKGQTLRTETMIHVPKTPGYYQIEAALNDLTANGHTESIGSDPLILYVATDPASLRSGTIDVNKRVMVNKHVFTVKKLTMGPQATEISINLSHPLMANGLAVKLLDQNEHEVQNLKINSNLGGNGNDTFRFGPIPKTVTQLSFVVVDVQDQLPNQSGKSEGGGPWQVEIPLP